MRDCVDLALKYNSKHKNDPDMKPLEKKVPKLSETMSNTRTSQRKRKSIILDDEEEEIQEEARKNWTL